MLRFAVLGSVLSMLAGCGGGGSRCTVVQNTDGSATITCDDGTRATARAGMNGTSCTVTDAGNGTKLIACADGTMVTVTDGMNGHDGMNGDAGRNALLTGPGLVVTIQQAGVDATTRRPFAQVQMADAAGNPLDREGHFTQGPVDVHFTVAYLPVEVRIDATVVLPYVNYNTVSVTSADGATTATQAAPDSGGTWTEVDGPNGVYRYDFGVVLPTDYAVDKSHRIGLYATRPFDGTTYVSNDVHDFRPDGMAIVDTRNVITTEACNTCHSPLAMHNGERRDTRLCVTCHARGYDDPDTGHTLDFENMVHRIHRGSNLPSNRAGIPYGIADQNHVVNDFSTVEFPQDIRNCNTCHQGTDGQRWNTEPARAACGSCHDDVYFEAGTPPAWMHLHPGGDRPDDTRCTVCHEPASPALAPIMDEHFTKFQEPYAATIVATINSASLTSTRNVMLDFTVTVNGTGRDVIGSPMTSLTALVAGPTTDYRFNTSFNMTLATAGTLTAVDAASGHFTWTSAATVDTIVANVIADPERTASGIAAAGSWAIGMETTLRVNDMAAATTTACTGTTTTTCTAPVPEGGRWGCVSGFCTPQYTYAATNPVAYFPITDTVAVPRREVVAVENCNHCHQQLALHGGGRNNPEYCVMCHNSTWDTIDRMPVPTGTTAITRSLSLAHFVHRIHTGENGVTDATYWAPRPATPINAGGTPVVFNDLQFPADRRVCNRCHVQPAAGIDLESMMSLAEPRWRQISDTRAVLQTFSMGAMASACTGCHDEPAVFAHASTMTSSSDGEACVTCHAAGQNFGIDLVHARPEFDLP